MEHNYKIYDKELLTIMLALDEWRHYLMGTFQDFEIWTDHQNLQYFWKLQKLNWWQAHWVTELAEYYFTLYHKASATNRKADLLSWQADHEQGKDNNNQVIVLKLEHFSAMIMPTIDEMHKHIKRATHDVRLWDPNVVGSINHNWGMKLKEGLVWYDGRIYIPRSHTSWGEVIAQLHDHITARHPGVKKTKELILWEYWWPKMKKDIEAYIWACEMCQWTKLSMQAKAAPLHPNTIPSWPWTHISVDMITGLPESNGYDPIIMIVDWFSKEIIPVACSTELLSEGWERILCDEVYAKHRMPQVVISVRGTQFVSKFMKDLYDLLQIKSNVFTAFHLQTNGQTECVNEEIEKYLRIFVNHLQMDWTNWLPLTAFAHNNHTHSSTGKSPFEVNYSFNPDIVPGVKSQHPFRTPASTTFISKMQEIHTKAKQSLEKAANQIKAEYDKRRKPAVEYQPGDKVWLDTTNLHLPHPKKKLSDKRTSPFKITAKKGASTYTLNLSINWHIHPTFNEILLTPYTHPAFPNQEQPPPPPPDLIDGAEHYKVKQILNSWQQKVRGKQGELSRSVTDYFVKWKGYRPELNSWVREDNMDADEAIEEFLAEHVNLAERIDEVNIVIPEPTRILDAEYNKGPRLPRKWRYLIQPPVPADTKWYYEKEVTEYSDLIINYWQKDKEDGDYGPNKPWQLGWVS